VFRVWLALDLELPLAEVADAARRAEALGADCVTIPDMAHDALLAAGAAVQATRRIEVATSAIVCFARSPMTVAVAAWDLQACSQGRFRLGLGPLVAPILTQKYGTQWHPPAPRMREYVACLRAIFACWQDDAPATFEGRHYRFTRQNAYNKPPRIDHPLIPIHLAAIGPRMSALAGEIATGVMAHPTNSSRRFLSERMLPQLARGAARGGRTRADVEVVANPLCAVGHTASALHCVREEQRALLAMLLSTPSYWPSLELFGWAERGEQLRQLVREKRFAELSSALSEEMVDAFLPSALWPELAGVLRDMYAGVADAIALALPRDPKHDSALGRVIEELRGSQPAGI
jgi:probable F420-dependent oxidoreductase